MADWSSWNKRENMSSIDSAHVEEKTSASAAVSVTEVSSLLSTHFTIFFIWLTQSPLFFGWLQIDQKQRQQKLNGQFEVKAV